MSKRILIIVAHTDDETIGMGGTIAKHKENGDEVFAISMTNGVSSRKNVNSKEINERVMAAKKAAKILNFNWLDNFDFPDNAMDKIPLINVVQKIERAKKQINPKIIYTHSFADLNIDHQIVCKATLTAFRPQDKEIYEEISCFETASSTDFSHESIAETFKPNKFVDIKKYLNKKTMAMKAYSSELKSFPHSRSLEGIKNLNAHRGTSVGLESAEAFQTLRSISR